MKVKYLYVMLTWLYKFLGKTLLSPSWHVFPKLCCFVTCKLDEILNLLYTPSVLAFEGSVRVAKCN